MPLFSLVLLYLAKEARSGSNFELGKFLTNYFKSVALFVNVPFFLSVGFLLNKEVAWPFLRLKSFFEARFRSCFDLLQSQILCRNHEKCFLFCANCFQISNWVHNFYKIFGNAIFCPNRCLRTLSLCFSPVFLSKLKFLQGL